MEWINIADAIDIYRCSLRLEHHIRGTGKQAFKVKCDTKSCFKNKNSELTLIMAILDNQSILFSFHQTYTKGGIDVFGF